MKALYRLLYRAALMLNVATAFPDRNVMALREEHARRNW